MVPRLGEKGGGPNPPVGKGLGPVPGNYLPWILEGPHLTLGKVFPKGPFSNFLFPGKKVSGGKTFSAGVKHGVLKGSPRCERGGFHPFLEG